MKHLTLNSLKGRANRGCAVADDMLELWAVELDILLEIDRICKKLGIRYFLAYGTLLGAVRHQGFIPWDDDIDIGMLREDYERFRREARAEFQHPYFLQDIVSDPLNPSVGLIKIRNSETALFTEGQLRNKTPFHLCNQGVFVDIFPFDSIPEDAKAWRRLSRRLARLRDICYHRQRAAAMLQGVVWKKNQKLLYTLRAKLQTLYHCLTGRDLLLETADRLSATAARYNEDPSAVRCNNISFDPRVKRYDSALDLADCRNLSEVEFEGFRFPAPGNVEKSLTRLFGNWRTPVRGTAFHTTSLFDVRKSYQTYLSQEEK